MGLLSLLFPERRSTAVIARERLKIVLAHERASRDAPDFLPVLQRELLDVIGRYVEIREDVIRVNLGKSGETSLLEINVEIDSAKVRPTKNGAAGDGKSPSTRIEPGGAAPWVKPI
jgi:cell division topological specificity factor